MEISDLADLAARRIGRELAWSSQTPGAEDSTMRNMLRRLWARRPAADPIGLDLAGGDWTPPPPSEVGSPDWAGWLSEESPRPRVVQASASPTTPLMLTLPSSLLDRSDDIVGTWAEPMEHPEDAELAERLPLPAELAEPPLAATEPVPPPPARRRRDTLGGGRARIRTPIPERRWRDLLSGLAGEHLTDEELAIIRKQMVK
jgi:hypothetical protein